MTSPTYLVIDHSGDVLNWESKNQSRVVVIKDIYDGQYRHGGENIIGQIIEVCVDENSSRDVTEDFMREASLEDAA